MSITQSRKNEIKSEAGRHEKDSGSPEVQVSILTARIKSLTEHLKRNKHDYSSQRGLLMMVSRRNRLLRYLRETDRPAYQALIQRLGLRR
jgi:small subunit ribosomal protein S15